MEMKKTKSKCEVNPGSSQNGELKLLNSGAMRSDAGAPLKVEGSQAQTKESHLEPLHSWRADQDILPWLWIIHNL